jgi:hypothetical protein
MFLPSVCSADVREDTLEDTYSDILENIAENEREVLGTNNTDVVVDYFKSKGNMSDFEATVFLDMVAFSTGRKSYFEYIINGTRGISPHDNGVISGFENQLNRFRFANESVRREILYHGGSLSGTIRFVMDCSESSEHMAYSLDCGEEYANDIKAIGVMLEDNPLSLDTDDLENRLDKAVNGWRDEIYTHFMDYAYRINGSSSENFNFGVNDSVKSVMAKVNNLSVLKNKMGDVSGDCIRAGAICTGVGGILAPTFGAFDVQQIVNIERSMELADCYVSVQRFLFNNRYYTFNDFPNALSPIFFTDNVVCVYDESTLLSILGSEEIYSSLNSGGEIIICYEPTNTIIGFRSFGDFQVFNPVSVSVTPDFAEGSFSKNIADMLYKGSKGPTIVDYALSVIFFVLIIVGIVLTIVGVELITIGLSLEKVEYNLNSIIENLKCILDLKSV